MLHGRVLVMAAIVPLLSVVGSCSRSIAMGVLFGPDGREYVAPSASTAVRVESLPKEERERLVDELVTLLTPTHEYSRLVAAKALMLFWRTHREGLSQRNVQAFVNACISPGDTILDIPVRRIRAGTDQPGFLMRPQCIVYVDGEDVLLHGDVPREWDWADGIVTIDGRIWADGLSRTRGSGVFAPLTWREVIPEEKLLGDHVVCVQITVVAPNGVRAVLRRETKMRILTDAEHESVFSD